MLTADYLDFAPEAVVALYREYEQRVLNDIARRLAGLDYARPTAAWQMQRLTESGLMYEQALAELSKITGRSEATLRQLFQDAGVRAMAFDDAIYKAAGLVPLPLNLSPAMMNVLAIGLQKTQGSMRNLTLTSAIDAQNVFTNAADMAYMQVSSGAFDYNSAIRQAVKSAADEGIGVINFASGRRDQLDVAMRRTVLTGVNQTAGQLQLARADELGVDLVQTSAHIGARNKGVGPANHEGWQGRIFSISGKHPKYPNFQEETGYGTGAGLCGWNCRHSFYSYFEGISENAYSEAEVNEYASKRVTYQGEEMSVYEATQKQRGIEREIRKAKREADALDAAGLDNSGELQRVRDYQAKMREFTRETGLSRQRAREQVVPGRKTVGFSFLSGDTSLNSTQQAIALGKSKQGWDFHEKDFRENYLKPFKLKDDVTQTIGYWGGPEPSFNASVSGKREDFLSMAKKWGKDYNQQAMAVLLPNKNGEGGKLTWLLDHQLTTTEWDNFFGAVDRANQELAKSGEYFGVTTKSGNVIEFWFDNQHTRMYSLDILNRALQIAGIKGDLNVSDGYEFLMLFKGSDY